MTNLDILARITEAVEAFNDDTERRAGDTLDEILLMLKSVRGDENPRGKRENLAAKKRNPEEAEGEGANPDDERKPEEKPTPAPIDLETGRTHLMDCMKEFNTLRPAGEELKVGTMYSVWTRLRDDEGLSLGVKHGGKTWLDADEKRTLFEAFSKIRSRR